MPVYECCGNHEGYVEAYSRKILLNWLDLQEMGLSTHKNTGNDVFIFVGQSKKTTPLMSREHFEWLGTKLEENKTSGALCLSFIPYVDASDSGNPNGLHGTPLFNYTNVSKHGYDKSTFITLMANYQNAILFSRAFPYDV